MKTIFVIFKQLSTERLFLLILFSSMAYSFSGYGVDVYLHLTTGKHILLSQELSHIDMFSFTAYGERWVMHEWLYQVLLYSIESAFDVLGLKLFGATVFTTILYVCKKNGELAGASNLSAWASTLILYIAWINFTGLRPHIITLLFFTLLLHFILLYRYRGQTKWLYTIPVIMLLWTNSHGGFLVGIILLSYVTFVFVVERIAQGSHQKIPWPLVYTLFASTAASLVNPYGYEQLLFPFQLMDQWVMRYVTEWQSPDFSQWNTLIFLFAVLTFGLLFKLTPKEERLFQALLITPFILASFDAVRHLPIAAIILAPFLARQFTAIKKLLRNKNLNKAKKRQNPSTLSTAMNTQLGASEYILNWFVLTTFCGFLLLIHPTIKQHATEAHNMRFPVGATQYLIDNNINGRMFTSLEYSDYILYHRYPKQKVFYDVRLELYGEELSKDYLKIVNAHTGWQATMERYAFDFAVLNKSTPIYRALRKEAAPLPIYEDKYSAIFLIQ